MDTMLARQLPNIIIRKIILETTRETRENRTKFDKVVDELEELVENTKEIVDVWIAEWESSPREREALYHRDSQDWCETGWLYQWKKPGFPSRGSGASGCEDAGFGTCLVVG